MKKGIVCLLAIVLVASLTLAGRSDGAPKLPKLLDVGSTPPPNVYQACAAAVAAVLAKNTPINVINKPMAGPAAYLPLMNDGEMGLSLTSLNEVSWYMRGNPAVTKKPLRNLRLIVRGNYLIGILGIVVKAKSDFHNIKELKGKRVTGVFGGNPICAALVDIWLRSVGMTFKDVHVIPVMQVPEGTRALAEGRVDGAFGGVVTSSFIKELNATMPIRALHFADTPANKANQISNELVDKVIKGSGVSFEVDVYKADGNILKDDYTSVKHPNGVVASSHLSDDTVYTVTKALWEHYKELHPYHPWLKQWQPKQMFDSNPMLPYHPGAVKFFKEAGVWTPQVEQKQKELMREVK